jgi:hypothetical protein
LEDRVTPSTFFVTNTNDSGPGSLRQAISDAKSPLNPGADQVSFSLLATDLRHFYYRNDNGIPIIPGTWKLHASTMIRRDLNEARKEWLQSFRDARQRTEAEQSDFLAFRDAEGRYADFHALRHSFITMIGKAGGRRVNIRTWPGTRGMP